MNRRELLICVAASAGLAAGCARRAPGWVRAAGPVTRIRLPAPLTDGTISVEQAIARRRSRRSFAPDAVGLDTIAQLLWAGQGITSADGKRSAPSAGALYPLELYVVFPDRLLHYLPDGHRADVRRVPDLRGELADAAYGQDPVARAPAVLVVAAATGRTRRKYGARATSFVDREAGHCAQNVLLVAAARGLAAVPIGSVDAARAAEVLALPAGQSVLYLVPVGHPGTAPAG